MVSYVHGQVAAPYLTGCFGQGRSYETGYQGLGALTALSSDPSSFFFLECQSLFIEQQNYGGNLGVGWRKVLQPHSELCGIHLFYDCRGLYNRFLHQLGVGFEYITHHLDFRLNGYLPFGPKTFPKDSFDYHYGDGYVVSITEGQTAMWGLDFQIGKSVPLNRWLSFFASLGPYFYDTFKSGCNSQALLGGTGRFGARFFSLVNLEFLYTYDRIFKSCPQFQLTLNSVLSRIPETLFPFLSPARRNPIIIHTSTCNYQTNF